MAVQILTDLDMTGNSVYNVATPVNPADAANKAYVDGALAVGLLKFSADIGDGINTSYVVNHNLNEADVLVSIKDNSSGDLVVTDVTELNTNQIQVDFLAAPTLNQYRVTVVG